MIVYVVGLAALSKSAQNRGRRAWRIWKAYREFANTEARVVATDEKMLLQKLQLTCVSIRDSVGYHNRKDSWAPRVHVTICEFRLVKPTQSLSGYGCTDLSHDELWQILTSAGFEIRISDPMPSQPTTTPRSGN